MTQEYQLETIFGTRRNHPDEATGALASPTTFQQPTNIQNLAILLVLTIHELKPNTRNSGKTLLQLLSRLCHDKVQG